MAPDIELQELLQTLDPTSQTLYAEVILGKDAEELVQSELGKTMIGLARQDYSEAAIALTTTAWWRRGRIRQLQQKAANSRAFLGYLQELVIRGRQAQTALTESENSDA